MVPWMRSSATAPHADSGSPSGRRSPCTTSRTSVPSGSGSPACFSSRTCRAPTGSATQEATSPSGRTPAAPSISRRSTICSWRAPPPIVLPPSYVRSLTIQSELRPGMLGIGNASAVMRGMLALERRAQLAGFGIETGLPALLSAVLHQQSLMDTIVVVAAVQLVLLAMWVLTSALMRSADLRRAELRVARLRGFPLPSLLAVSITEPAALCAVGVVLGIVGAWGVVLLAASILFTPGTTVGLDAWTFGGFCSGGADDLRRSGSQLDAIAAQLRAGSVVPAVRRQPFTSRDRRLDPRRIGRCAGRRGHQRCPQLSHQSDCGGRSCGRCSRHVGYRDPHRRIPLSPAQRRDPRFVRRGRLLGRPADRPAADGAARGTDSRHRGRSRLLRSVRVVGRARQSAHRRDVLDRRAHRRHGHRG